MPATLTVLYPSDGKFDEDYYLKTHMPLVGRLWGKYGLQTWRITKLASPDPSNPSKYQIQADLVWPDVQSIQAALKGDGAEILGDIPNFYDKQADIIMGEVIGTGKGE